MAQVAQSAPYFKAKAVVNGDIKEISLNDYKGKWLVFFFYPLDFTFVCPTEILAFNEQLDKFKALGAEVLGCSVDSEHTHRAWMNTAPKDGGIGKLQYPLLADITKDIARDYGVLLPAGIALRGLFLINPEGKIEYSVIHNLGVGRSVEETLRVLEGFQTVAKSGEVCPANWKKGATTMKATPEGVKGYLGGKH
ncbi:MAG: peroxiredoxin [Oligoflexia bacterium]|nr:peroxiredoxin [Oligoflexia bacterium]